jgi:quercetin dioxygenase-like cupin family protein
MKITKPKIVGKPWGREIWLAEEDEYAGKIIEIKEGSRTSLHYHKKKKETLYVLKGKLKLNTSDAKEFILDVGDSITILPKEVHRLFAIADLKIVEVSMSKLDDVVRVEDDHGRK